MSSVQVRAHIEGERRLRQILSGALSSIWSALPGYDERNVDEWLNRVLPLVSAGQRQSVAFTEAYLAAVMGRKPIGVDSEQLIGSAVRQGASPQEVYRRPFVTVWSSLGAGNGFEDAVGAGLARAVSTAAMDVQLSARATFNAVGQADDGIFGYERVADPGACEFCSAVDGAYVKDGDAMPLHNNCGCSLEPLTEPHPRAVYLPSGESVADAYAIRDHGELGPLLVAPEDHFTHL